MAEFWKNLSGRERLLLKVGGGLLTIAILVQLIVLPVLGWRADQHARVDDAQSLYRMIAEAAPQAKGRNAGAGDSATPIRNAVSQSARAAGVELVYVNARPDGSVDANIASADPATLYAWLEVARGQYGIVVRSADIGRDSGNPAAVRAQLTLTRQQ